MTDDKRAALKARIEAAQDSEAARRAKKFATTAQDQAVVAKDKFTSFAKEHPVATVAGGVALGVLVASLFKAPRQAAIRTGTKAAGLASVGGEAALAFATEMLASAGAASKEGLRKIEDVGDSVGDTARQAKRDAGYLAGNASDAARIAGREAGKTILRAIGRG